MIAPRAYLLLFVLTLSVALPLFGEESPITSPPISEDYSPAAIVAATQRGAATAARDIKAGTFRILHFGIPWPVGKPLIDEFTGYRVQTVAGCVVSKPFVAEVEAYNEVMREWHPKHK